eukprot:1126668-Amphidinium_carterae.1
MQCLVNKLGAREQKQAFIFTPDFFRGLRKVSKTGRNSDRRQLRCTKCPQYDSNRQSPAP